MSVKQPLIVQPRMCNGIVIHAGITISNIINRMLIIANNDLIALTAYIVGDLAVLPTEAAKGISNLLQTPIYRPGNKSMYKWDPTDNCHTERFFDCYLYAKSTNNIVMHHHLINVANQMVIDCTNVMIPSDNDILLITKENSHRLSYPWALTNIMLYYPMCQQQQPPHPCVFNSSIIKTWVDYLRLHVMETYSVFILCKMAHYESTRVSRKYSSDRYTIVYSPSPPIPSQVITSNSTNP